jgi:hypothetical protein
MELSAWRAPQRSRTPSQRWRSSPPASSIHRPETDIGRQALGSFQRPEVLTGKVCKSVQLCMQGMQVLAILGPSAQRLIILRVRISKKISNKWYVLTFFAGCPQEGHDRAVLSVNRSVNVRNLRLRIKNEGCSPQGEAMPSCRVA